MKIYVWHSRNLVTQDEIFPYNAGYYYRYCIYYCHCFTIKGTSEQIKDNLIGSGNNTVNVTLSQGDSAYSVDYYDGSSSGSTPILSQSLKDEVLKTDHVENATFFTAEQTTTAVFTMRTAVFPVVRSMALIPII